MRRQSMGMSALKLSVILVCVAVIVGTALPHYMRLQAQAKSVFITWTASSLRTAMTLVHTQALLDSAKEGWSITVERPSGKKAKVLINQMLNPTANKRGIIEAIEIPDALMRTLDITFEEGGRTRSVIYAVRRTTLCKISYTEDMRTGLISIRQDTSDCR